MLYYYDMRKQDTKHFNTEILLGTIAIVLFIIASIILSSIFNIGAAGSNTLLSGLKSTVGVFAYITPLILLYMCYVLWTGRTFAMRKLSALGGLLSTLSIFGILGLINQSLSGTLGSMISTPLLAILGAAPTFVALLGTTYMGLMILTGKKNLFSFLDKKDEDEELDHKPNILIRSFKYLLNLLHSLINTFSFDGIDLSKNKKNIRDMISEEEEAEDYESDAPEKDQSEDLRSSILKKNNNNNNNRHGKNTKENIDDDIESLSETPLQIKNPNRAKHFDMEFVPPPIDILSVDSGRSSGGDTKSKGKTIQNTLAEFGIPVEISGVTVGPTVTQFRVKTPQGFKVKSIMNYHDNIQMNLAADSIHIDAPIPGQSVVGIDVPNKDKQMLGLGTLIDTAEFKNSNNLTVVMGKDIVGRPVYGDIESMPHLLIAGATKSGKSVTIQNIITSLLYKNSPEDLKLIIIDPKKVEFTVYKNLPHLYTPVITDARNAIKCLNWAIIEMERRYDYFADNYEGIQNITDYNNKILYPAMEKERRKKNPDPESLPEKFPFIVIVFDEFNDFMLNYGKEITSLITSLTQKARAAGMHLILATQRPDVKVINGTIKANIPARIALRTSSRIDSQTILDQGGAEDLLGNGDMLFLNPGKKPQRVQAPFVSSDEVKNVIRYIKDRYYGYEAPLIDYTKVKDSISNGEISVNNSGNSYHENTGDEEEENLYNSAKEYVIAIGRASATNLQSKFSLGFAKANRMMMMLEERGVVGPLEGNKRKVLIGKDGASSSNYNDADTSVEDLF